MTELFDVAVVGGGLVGRAAALTVAQRGFATLHLAPKGPPDRRTSALMNPSVAFLSQAGLIAQPDKLGHRLTQIRIIDATKRLIRAPETLFDSRDAGLDGFGWNFANAHLADEFEAVAGGLPSLVTRHANAASLGFANSVGTLTLSDGTTVSASLIVGADGKGSLVRRVAGIVTAERRFTQSAFVCDLVLSRPLNGMSVEFHYGQGPFTLVPAGGDRANLVWIDAPAPLVQARALAPTELGALLTSKAMHLFGPITPAGPSQVFPLSTLTVAKAGKPHVVLVGEAAHAFPPIGAQGLNLGLRDVADLGAALDGIPRTTNWPQPVGDDYAARRAPDLRQTGQMVDLLFRSLIAEMLPAQAARAAGLWALKLVPQFKRSAYKLGMGSDR